MSIISYQSTLNSNNPDCVYEEFWLTFKNSIMNSSQNNTKSKELYGLIQENSVHLNTIQQEKKDGWVETIQNSISSYMLMYALICLNMDPDDGHAVYHHDILVTNIHRWQEINKERERRCNNEEMLMLLYEIMKCKSHVEPELRATFYQIFTENSHLGIIMGELVVCLLDYNQAARLNRLLHNDLFHDHVIDVLNEVCPFKVDRSTKESRKLIRRYKETKQI